MRISKSELRQIISEELEVILTNEEAGEFFGEEVQRRLEEEERGEGSMAVNQLSNISQMASELADLVDDSDNLDEWVESKITKAHDYLNTVLNHLSAEESQRIDPDSQPLKEAPMIAVSDDGRPRPGGDLYDGEKHLDAIRAIAQDLPPTHLALLSAQIEELMKQLDDVSQSRPSKPDLSQDRPLRRK